MYRHLVMWTLKDEVNGRSKEENAKEMKKRLESLPAVLKEIKEYEVGINIGNYAASFFDIGLVSSFESKEEFEKYTKYQEHDKVLEFIKSIELEEHIVDYEE